MLNFEREPADSFRINLLYCSMLRASATAALFAVRPFHPASARWSSGVRTCARPSFSRPITGKGSRTLIVAVESERRSELGWGRRRKDEGSYGTAGTPAAATGGAPVSATFELAAAVAVRVRAWNVRM